MIAARSLAQDGLTYWTAGAAPQSRRSAPPTVHLLPIYDEYLVAYRDRLAVPHGPGSIARLDAASVTFQHAVVIDGRVAGTWRVDRTRSTPAVRVTALRRLVSAERRALEAEAERYGRFTGISVSLSIG
jgi:Winged helix DNA-binding domain